MNILTSREAKLLLNITDDKQDDLITMLVTTMSTTIETYCDRSFGAADYIEYQDGDGTDTMYTDQWPINSIASIYDDPAREFLSDSLLAATDYTYYANEGRISLLSSVLNSKFSYCFSPGYNNVKITYNAGYTAIPSDLKLIASEIMGKKYKNIMDKRWGFMNVSSAGEGFQIMVNDLLPDHRMFLDMKYRNRKSQ